MSESGVALVLVAALLHASWNAIVKSQHDRLIGTWAVITSSALVGLPLLAIAGLPELSVWWIVVVSAMIHLGYNLALSVAYDRADLSVAYPIARGIAPLIVTLGAFALLDDSPSMRGVAGVVLVSISLVMLVRSRPTRNTIWAVVTGLAIAAYTIVDGFGVRTNGDAVQFISAVFVLNAVILTAVVARWRGSGPMRNAVVAQPGRLLAGGAASAGAYLLVMVVARTEPLGLVAGLRETSALFGLAIGSFVLKEPVTGRLWLAVLVGLAGTLAIVTA